MRSEGHYRLSSDAIFWVFCTIAIVLAPVVMDLDRLDGA